MVVDLVDVVMVVVVVVVVVVWVVLVVALVVVVVVVFVVVAVVVVVVVVVGGDVSRAALHSVSTRIISLNPKVFSTSGDSIASIMEDIEYPASTSNENLVNQTHYIKSCYFLVHASLS